MPPLADSEGFPWTGLTLVLVVLGLIAFMAVPSAPLSPRARAAERLEIAATHALTELRAGVRDYYLDHRRFPGENPRPSTRESAGARWLERQLTLHTDDQGNPAGAATAEHVFGPYLPAGFPANAVNGLATVRLVRDGEPFEPDDTTGWIYRVEDGDIRLNTSTTLRGSTTRYFDL